MLAFLVAINNTKQSCKKKQKNKKKKTTKPIHVDLLVVSSPMDAVDSLIHITMKHWILLLNTLSCKKITNLKVFTKFIEDKMIKAESSSKLWSSM